MILTALTDVDVVLGMDVLSQFDVKIDLKKTGSQSSQRTLYSVGASQDCWATPRQPRIHL